MDRSAGTGQPGQVSSSTGWLEKVGLARTATTNQKGYIRLDRSTWLVRLNRLAWTGEPGKVSLDRLAWTGHPR